MRINCKLWREQLQVRIEKKTEKSNCRQHKRRVGNGNDVAKQKRAIQKKSNQCTINIQGTRQNNKSRCPKILPTSSLSSQTLHTAPPCKGKQQITSPSKRKTSTHNVGLMLAHRLRHWINIGLTLSC